MIKTLIVGGIIISFFTIVIGYTDIFTIMLRFKGDEITVLSYFFSPLTVFVVNSAILYDAIHKIFRNL